MSTLSLMKSDVSRWMSGGLLMSIVKISTLCILPIVALYSYGQVQSVQRQVAEDRVEQLTLETGRLQAALKQVEQFEHDRQIRERQHSQAAATLAGDTSSVLDQPAPDSVVDILRPVLDDPADSNGP